MNPKYCLCGCKNLTKWNGNNYSNYLIGHSFKNKILSEKHKFKISESHKGLFRFLETRLKISKALRSINKGKKFSIEHNYKISKALKGKKLSDERKHKISESLKGKLLSEETKKKLSEIHKGRILSEELKKKLSNSHIKLHKEYPNLKKDASERMKKLWKNKEFVEKRLESFNRSPNNFAIEFNNFLQLKIEFNNFLQLNFPNEWKYTGDFSFWIGRKNPDFVNINGKKVCIEIYNEYFKVKNYSSTNEYIKNRSNHFLKYGWKTIFVNQKEFIYDKKLVLEKISKRIN